MSTPQFTRRTARERQQALLRDCAKQYPGLAPLFTMKQKTNYSVTHRPDLDELPPRFATLQHHLTDVDTNNSIHNATTLANQIGIQHVVHPIQAAFLTANPMAALPPPGAPPINPAPITHLTIQPHAALTPQEVAKHKLLRQIGLLPQFTSQEIQARRERIAERKRNVEALKKQVLEAHENAKTKKDSLKSVKTGRVEKTTTKVTATVKAVEGNEEDEELGGKFEDLKDHGKEGEGSKELSG